MYVPLWISEYFDVTNACLILGCHFGPHPHLHGSTSGDVA